jgi:hypothetical protein
MSDATASPAYWPDPPAIDRASAGRRSMPFSMWLRHLPTRENRDRALALFGERARPLLDAWTRLVEEAAGDVEALALRMRPLAEDPGGRGAIEGALANLSEFDASHSARLSLALERVWEREPVRDAAFHIVEDATFLTELVRHEVPFALVAHPYGLSPLVIAGGPGEPPRLLDPAGDEAEQARHAEAVRALRAIVGASEPYWSSPAFRALCGRDMAVAKGPAHLGAVLAAMRGQGHDKAFLKHTLSKQGTWVAELRDGGIASGMLAAHAAMGPAYLDLHRTDGDGHRRILVQDFLPFTHEHRFLVVGHRVVASTASTRTIGALDHAGRRLHPGVARLDRPADAPGSYDRGSAETTEDRRLVARMARVARRVASALRREGILPDCYCLDVGLCARGVLPIEVNGLNHCGIYAADWSRVARALAGLPSTAPQAAPAGNDEADGEPTSRGDKVDDALDFILDILCDEPPSELARVARRLSDLALERDPVTARALGVVARDRNRRDAEEDPLPEAQVAEARSWLDGR